MKYQADGFLFDRVYSLTHSHPQYQLEVSSQLGVLAALPAGKDPAVSTH